MLDFNELGHDVFRRFYVDGRLYHHLLVNESNLKAGIQEIRPIDAMADDLINPLLFDIFFCLLR